MYRWLKIVCCLLLTSNLSAQYIYEANQSLIDLTGESGTTNLNAADDQVSSVFNLGFTFDFYGQPFTQGRMATNGCLHFKTTGAYCSDYRPDPLTNQYTYTLLPFWTDLIRDNGSKMLAKSFSDKTVFGWYNLREYNRSNTDNSFEVILWTNDTFEFRYGALNIINHDVLIGEIGNGSSEVYQYLFHDECNVGSTNSSSCVNTNWNNTSSNTLLESGGSLYGVGTGNSVDCSDPLNNSGCSGYAAAYLTQQCNITQLYSESCPSYWEAYDDQQCDEDPQYAPFCAGYRQEESVAFFDEQSVDYGFIDEQEQFASGIFTEDQHHDNLDFEDAVEIIEIHEEEMFLPFEEFGDNPNDYFEDPFIEEFIVFYEPEPLPFIDDFMPRTDDPFHQDEVLIDEFIFQETFLIEDYSEPETFIEFNSVEELEEWFEEETNERFEERIEEELADLDEPEEEFIEEIFEEEVVEEVFEEIEEMREEFEEERLADIEEEQREETIEEAELVEKEISSGKSSISRSVALKVVSSTIATANQSMSGTTAGNSTHSGSGSSSYSTGSSVVGNSINASSNAGVSVSSSPSMSDQFASSTAQNNQVLSMSVDSTTTGSSFSTTTTFEVTTDVGTANTQTQNVTTEIQTALNDSNTSSDADKIADQILAANIKEQQKEIQEEQENTGEYGDESTLVALIGFVPDFDQYRTVYIPDQKKWYPDQVIYNTILNDNTEAFYSLAGESLKTLARLKEMQPNL